MVEATPATVRLTIGVQATGTPNQLSTTLEQAQLLLSLIKSKTLVSVETQDGTSLSEAQVNSNDFWRHLFASLADNGTFQAWLPGDEGVRTSVESMLKMHGFVQVQFSNPEFQNGRLAVVASKPAFKSGGTSLKNRKTQKAVDGGNPWANLATEEAAQINEDSLMRDEAAVKAMTEKFACDGDRIMPGKPCENCTCGKKELYEGKITLAQLENGQVESSCGKCYLGDAFRCAGCPFRGKPAFEPGDKVKLQGNDTASATADVNILRAAEVTTAQTGSTKVVLEL